MSTKTTEFTPVVNTSTVTEYREADRKGKANLLKTLRVSQRAAVEAMDLEAWANLSATMDACTTATKPERVELDPALVIAQRVADLSAAIEMLKSGTHAPAGIAWDGTDLPTVEADSENAARIATAKITRSTDRNSIQAVIDRAFDGAESGTYMSVQDISNTGGIEGYRPSPGAVAARLFPRNGGDCTLESVEPVEVGTMGNTQRGAVLI